MLTKGGECGLWKTLQPIKGRKYEAAGPRYEKYDGFTVGKHDKSNKPTCTGGTEGHSLCALQLPGQRSTAATSEGSFQSSRCISLDWGTEVEDVSPLVRTASSGLPEWEKAPGPH